MSQNKSNVILIRIATIGICFLFYCSSLYYYGKLNFGKVYLKTKLNSDLIPTYNHSRWIVVTSTVEPTKQLKNLVALPDWKVVVVGDRNTPNNWSLPGCVYLSINNQLNLGYQITKHLPYNSYSRKMIGYLYAIQNGAQYIYEGDDDTCPSNGQLEFILEPISSGLIYADLSQPVMNPYPHFAQPRIWPRGFPLERIAHPPDHTYHLCTFHTPAVQQGLVNGDNKGSHEDTFDARAPPFTLPQGVFAPFNSQNTLFSYQALWALFLPTTVNFRVTDLWRGYWAQRLLWLTGNYISFHPPNAVQVRNPHSYLKDSKEDIQKYEESNKLVDFLLHWNCFFLNFFQCVEKLIVDMVKPKFIKKLDFLILKLWLSDLKKIGYKEPKNAPKQLENMCLSASNWVNYSPMQMPPNAGFIDLFNMCEVHLPQNHTSIKEVHNFDHNDKQQRSFSFENILLVIVFNKPFLQNIRLLEALYGDHFPNILFCGESKSRKELVELVNKTNFRWRNNDISFVNVSQVFGGWFSYECAIRAIEMNYNVDGYMFLGDDVLLKPWKLLPFDPSTSRIQNDTYGPHCYQDLNNKILAHFQWNSLWGKACGYNATNEAFKEIESIAKNPSDPRWPLFQTFIHNRFSNGVNMHLVSFSMSNFYYIAKQDSWIFAQILKIFLKHKVYIDIAVPTALIGCRAGRSQVDDGFLGISIWDNDTKDPLKFFSDEFVYIHPLKLSSLNNNENFLRRYCFKFVQQYFNNNW